MDCDALALSFTWSEKLPGPAWMLDLGVDPDHDCIVTTAEAMHVLISAYLAPDLDLLDCGGTLPQSCDPITQFGPRLDQVNDSLSLGVRFTMLPAVFTSPDGM